MTAKTVLFVSDSSQLLRLGYVLLRPPAADELALYIRNVRKKNLYLIEIPDKTKTKHLENQKRTNGTAHIGIAAVLLVTSVVISPYLTNRRFL